MAAHAIASDIDVVEGGRQPGNRRMAVVAGIAAGDVGRVFTGRRDAIMAGATGAQYLGVIDGKRRYKHIGAVAILADIGRLYVCRGLAGGVGAVVAVDAVARDVDVIEVGRQPACCRMAVVAGIAARDMCRILAGCCQAVMTGTAGTHDLHMVYRIHRRECICIVAVFADIRRRDVRRGLAGGLGTVMAAYAVTGDIDVIEIGRRPADSRMTIVAIIAAVQMCWMFALGRDAVMTGTAGAQDLCMVNGRYRRPDVRIVAVFAHIAGLYMCRILTGSFRAVVATDAVASDIHVVEIRG